MQPPPPAPQQSRPQSSGHAPQPTMQPQMLLGQPDQRQGQQLLRMVHLLKHCLAGSACAAMMSVAPGVACLSFVAGAACKEHAL